MQLNTLEITTEQLQVLFPNYDCSLSWIYLVLIKSNRKLTLSKVIQPFHFCESDYVWASSRRPCLFLLTTRKLIQQTEIRLFKSGSNLLNVHQYQCKMASCKCRCKTVETNERFAQECLNIQTVWRFCSGEENVFSYWKKRLNLIGLSPESHRT